jgi:hypothetical protein
MTRECADRIDRLRHDNRLVEHLARPPKRPLPRSRRATKSRISSTMLFDATIPSRMRTKPMRGPHGRPGGPRHGWPPRELHNPAVQMALRVSRLRGHGDDVQIGGSPLRTSRRVTIALGAAEPGPTHPWCGRL